MDIKILPNTYLIGRSCGIFNSNLEAKFKDLSVGLFVKIDSINIKDEKIARKVYWHCGDDAY